MKKIFAILGTALLVAAVLTGCSNDAGGSKDTPTASTNNGTNPGGNNNGTSPTPEQQMLGEKLAAVGTANQAAFNKLQELSMKASDAGGFEQSDIESAIKLVAAIEPKVADLKTKATEYLNIAISPQFFTRKNYIHPMDTFYEKNTVNEKKTHYVEFYRIAISCVFSFKH